MRFAAFLSFAVLAFAAGAHATTTRGTLSGVVKRGPVAPVCAVEQPCDEPAADVTLLFIRNGTVIARAVTNVQGRYRVRIPAGTYSVRRAVVSAAVDRKLDPNRVRVHPGRLTRLDFSIDTGIR